LIDKTRDPRGTIPFGFFNRLFLDKIRRPVEAEENGNFGFHQ
jgi:hypothetical protein